MGCLYGYHSYECSLLLVSGEIIIDFGEILPNIITSRPTSKLPTFCANRRYILRYDA